MSRLSDNDLFDAAVMIEEAYEIDIHKDIIFSNDLNKYHEYNLNRYCQFGYNIFKWVLFALLDFWYLTKL